MLMGLLVNSVQAHAGHHHEEPETGLEDLKDQEFDIELDASVIGSFIIKSIKSSKKASELSLEQTFGETTKKVKAQFSESKILSYSFNTGTDTYLIVIDFQNYDGSDNNAVRISYSNDSAERTLTSENIIVKLNASEETSEHNH